MAQTNYTVNSVILRRVQQRIKRGWTTRYMARDIEGNPIWPASGRACTWCLLGALIAEVPNDEEYDVYFHYLNERVPKIYHNEISKHAAAQFNDASTQEEVVEFLEGLIKELENVGK